MFADEVADLKDAYPARLQLVHVLSREPQEVELFSGRLTPPSCASCCPCCSRRGVDHWWLCGPFGLVTDAIAVLGRARRRADRIHRELFYVGRAAARPAAHAEPRRPAPAAR